MVGWVVAATLAWELSLAPSLEKVRPDRALPASTERARHLRLNAARGECEAAQLIVSAPGAPVRSLSVKAEPLQAEDAVLPVTLYRVGFVKVTTPSNTEGDVGEWPDPLIPVRDPNTGEARNAFPVDVEKGRHQPVFVELCVPVDAKPGTYKGHLQVTAEGLERTVPISLRVRSIVVPATSTFPTTFGLSGRSLEFGHHGRKKGDEERLRLVHLYAKEALRHRVSLHTMSMLPPRVTRTDKGLEVDFDRWDKEIAPFLNGTALPSGARFTSIDLRVPPDLTVEEHRTYLRLVEQHFQKRGWLDRLFSYVMDEPKPKDRSVLVERLQRLQGSKIRKLVTTALDPTLSDRIDLWVPNLPCLFVRGEDGELCARHPPRHSYRTCEKEGAWVWWYQSCTSHGCGSGPFGDRKLDRYFAGWPSYMVDAPGTAARAMAWLAFLHDIHGELYFDMAYAYNAAPEKDPWDGVWAFGGNGDGTLFYPGRPDRIGGKTHAAVTSLRLKHIRDGLEDLELLRQLERRGGPAQALARQLAPQPWKLEPDPGRWQTVRTQLLNALEAVPRP